ncbi:uncharacterized protein LOC131650589 [Vicia villosa]|uniref:uncharacterized protein LOC131650589 n=1 Tax=Vicia villosa TaxID=3911 RepID=UPI00273ADED9|nr:uncharacterized protein LOC131650589 [Vicia villosa]
MCLDACKKSFSFCRPIIGVDGCFLKGNYGGQILAAVGRDPNDQMLPIALAVVEAETRDSWAWFFDLLVNDLGGPEICKNITFISDQQKGLLPTIDELLPGVDQRFCVRHLYINFRKRFPGKQLKELMWKAAKATYPQAWEREMKEMRKVNEEAFKHLLKIPLDTGVIRKENYQKCYESLIYPTNGENLWELTPYPDVLPPLTRRAPGRPKKRRNKDADEKRKDITNVSRKGLPNKCSICGISGHNKSSCPSAPRQSTTTQTQTSQAQASQAQTPTTTVPTVQS